MRPYTSDYLLDKKVKIFQPVDGYRASTDAVFLSSLLDIQLVKPQDKILDIGSGTGAISLCLAERLKGKCINITGVDIQNDLVELSNFSAQENGFANFLRYEQLDIREKTLLPAGTFSFVITNPPYSDHDMPSPNLSKQLAHNHQNFDLTGWLSFALKMLKPKGYLLMINRTEAINETVSALNGKAGDVLILPIYSKYGQDAKRIAIIAKKGAKGISKILPPFYTHNPDGSYTEKAQSILRLGQGYF